MKRILTLIFIVLVSQLAHAELSMDEFIRNHYNFFKDDLSSTSIGSMKPMLADAKYFKINNQYSLFVTMQEETKYYEYGFIFYNKRLYRISYVIGDTGGCYYIIEDITWELNKPDSGYDYLNQVFKTTSDPKKQIELIIDNLKKINSDRREKIFISLAVDNNGKIEYYRGFGETY
ncbi:MAG: hypothetical protein J1E63_07865 [Muribaculaceae bacterium]|nr:hypothetical protein [Muribaculaceae bacterium]